MNDTKGAAVNRPYRYKSTETGAAIKDVDTSGRIVTGYLSVFGNKDSHGDIITAGAFTKTISERGPNGSKPRLKYLRNHMTDAILGKFTEMREDDYGLYFEAKISDTAIGRDTMTLIKDGVLNENSIGYETINEKYDEHAKANFLTEVKLWEGSAVTWGSNELAAVTGTKSAVEMAASYYEEVARIKSVLRNENITDDTGYMLEIWIKQIQTRMSDIISTLTTESAATPIFKEVASSAPATDVTDSTLNLLTLGIEGHAKGQAVDISTMIHLLQENP
jgi:HK97 family phage prohead protease